MLVDGTKRTGDLSWSVFQGATQIGGKVSGGALYAMELVDSYISPLPNQPGGEPSNPASSAANYVTTYEPVNTWEGLQCGFARLVTELGNLRDTAAYSSTVYQQAGLGSASLVALRSIPVAVLKPMLGIAGLSTLTLQGASNHFTDPEVVRQRGRHYDR